MATDLIMPRLPDQQPHAHLYQPQYYPPQFQNPQPPSQHVTPQISPLSTSNSASPTSPKSYHTRQLRPLYIPAVLRPNEYPSKQNLMRRRGTVDGGSMMKTNSSFMNLSGLGGLGRLGRRDSGKFLEGEWDLDLFPQPTAQPTRKHWKPDTESSVCDEPSCTRHFNYWVRRHHCRKCGGVFCDNHSNYDIPLDQDANYNPRGTISRACGNCFIEFQAWRSRTNSESSTESAPINRVSQTAPTSPLSTSPTTVLGGPTQPPKPEVAASVPRDWSWSTF